MGLRWDSVGILVGVWWVSGGFKVGFGGVSGGFPVGFLEASSQIRDLAILEIECFERSMAWCPAGGVRTFPEGGN